MCLLQPLNHHHLLLLLLLHPLQPRVIQVSNSISDSRRKLLVDRVIRLKARQLRSHRHQPPPRLNLLSWVKPPKQRPPRLIWEPRSQPKYPNQSKCRQVKFPNSVLRHRLHQHLRRPLAVRALLWHSQTVRHLRQRRCLVRTAVLVQRRQRLVSVL
jgi:hypothetical protein